MTPQRPPILKASLRITSYNVCYTKLLRPAFLLPNDKIEENLDKKIKEVWKGKTNAGKAKELEAALSKKKIELRNALVQQQELRRLEMEEEQTQIEIASCEKKIEKNEKELMELKRQLDFFEEYAE